MGNIFAAGEIVELGIQIEKNGRDFYGTLAGKSRDVKAKDMFAYLAKEEERHIVAFQGILSKIEKYEPPESYPGEYFAYMSALAGEYVFTRKDKGAQLAQEMKSDQEAIELGIGFEKDSIVFYEGMKKAVPAYGQKIVDELIAQEQNHLRILYELRR